MRAERPLHVGLVWTGLAVVSVVVVASGGAARLFLLGGLAVAGLGLVALLRGRVRWSRLGRRGGALCVAAGLVAALLGGAMSGQATSTTAAPSSAGRQGSSGATPSSPERTTITGVPGAVRSPMPPNSTVVPKHAAEPSISPVKAGSALAALANLVVKGRAPRTGYDRELFGPAWADVDRNGCDTRNDVLRRDLTAYRLKVGTHGCLVLSGSLRDPYTATTIAFVRGQATSAKVQIDHVVALSDAWQKGAQQWSTPQRTTYANDSLNLLAVDGLANQRKSDGDAATWLPPDKAYRCPYAARQVAVKAKYGLWVTSAEKDALARILATCPSQTLPTAAAFVLGGGPV
jgi:hypothetical protein